MYLLKKLKDRGLLLILLLLTSVSGIAQTKAGIYWIDFAIAEELRIEEAVDDNSRNWLSGFS